MHCAGSIRLIVSSSAAVYGVLEHIPFLDAYTISKMEAEAGLREIAKQSGMEVVVIRPALVYGPKVKGNFLSMMHWLYRGVLCRWGLLIINAAL